MMENIVVYLINLDTRTDRLFESQEETKKVGLPYIRIEAVDASDLVGTSRLVTPGVQACWESHMKALRKFLESSFERALILEDDFQIKEGSELLAALDSNLISKYDFVQLGFLTPGFLNKFLMLWSSSENHFFRVLGLLSTKIPGIRKDIAKRMRVKESRNCPRGFVPNNALPGTHCYLVSRDLAKDILELNNPQFLSADEFFISLTKMRSSLNIRSSKSLVAQRDSIPSISTRFTKGR
jgi:GR25 family glycosyltransferase involved in LPS biosynthesis